MIFDRHGIFIFPSFFEGFGKAFMEAMARGLCVVAAENGGMKDVIKHRENGIKVTTGDTKLFTHACLELISSPNVAAAISQNAIATARSYSWRRVALETLSFYQSLLEMKHA